MITSGFLMYYFESKKLMSEIKNNSELSFRRLTNTLKEPLWNMDYKEAEYLIKTEMEGHDVLSIIVYNESDKKIFGFIKNSEWKIENYDGDSVNNYFLFYENEMIKDSFKIGYLKIYFTDHYLKISLQYLVLKLIIQTLALTILTLTIIYFTVNKFIISPVIMLNRTVGLFANKDFKARINIKSEDEIGSLSNNFNNMAQTIEEYSENLEYLVDVRTKELNIANAELLETNNQMKKELKMAQRIQEAIIPKAFPSMENVDFCGMYIPMESLGGDYYDVFKISENKIGMVIADVCGHGVPAALITTMAKVSFNSNSRDDRTTKDIVHNVNNELFNIIGNMEYLTAFFCIIDTDKKTLQYTNAGHPEILIIRKNGEIIKLNQNGPVIGFLKDLEFECETVEIIEGDRIVLYTDGVIEARNDDNELFDIDRFRSILLNNINQKSVDLIKTISNEITNFIGDQKLNDDVTILIGDFSKNLDKIKFDLEIFTEKRDNELASTRNDTQKQIKEMNIKLYDAIEYSKLNEFEKSKSILEELAGKYNRKSDNIRILEILGFVYYRLGYKEKAVKVWEEVMKDNPENEKIKNNLRIVKMK